MSIKYITLYDYKPEPLHLYYSIITQILEI